MMLLTREQDCGKGRSSCCVLVLGWFFCCGGVFFPLRSRHCMTLNKCSLNPEVFEAPFYSIPSVKFGIVTNSLYH